MELKVGRTYRAKHPGRVNGYINDRTIRWISTSGTQVQYDGPAVAFGRHYPTVDRGAFERWAARDVTEALPEGEYQRWG